MHAVLQTQKWDKQPDRRTSKVSAEEQIGATPSMGGMPVLFRKSSCSCGGGCPSCQAKSGNLQISQPHDAAEIEADAIADRVMRMPIDAEKPKVNQAVSGNSIHRNCSACEEE